MAHNTKEYRACKLGKTALPMFSTMMNAPQLTTKAIAAMSKSSEFVLEFGVGKLPQDILPGILERLDAKQAKSVFGMLFNKTETMRLAYLDELIDGVLLLTGDPLTIVSDAAVIDDRMLISILVGR